MAGGFAIGGDIWNLVNNGAITTSTTQTAVISNASNNTKGSFVQLVASTSADISYLVITIDGVAPSFFFNWAVDIAVGASGSEQAKINNLMIGPIYSVGTVSYAFPFTAPKGTRISARSQCSGGAYTAYVSVIGGSSGFTALEGSCGVDSIGFTAGSTGGTSIPVSATANTLGSYVQLVASTARNYTGVAGYIDFAGSGADAGSNYMVNIAVGASGSEHIRIPDIFFAGQGSMLWQIPYFPIQIPKGTRLSASSQASATSEGSSPYVTLYGVY